MDSLCTSKAQADGRPLDRAFTDSVTIRFDSKLADGAIHYTLDGSTPTIASPTLPRRISFGKSVTLSARRFDAVGKPDGFVLVREFRKVPAVPHAAVRANVTIEPRDPGYFAYGANVLTDGRLADGDEAASPGWVGWERATVKVTLDLGKAIAVKSVGGHFLRAAGGIFLPESVKFSVSTDGISFKPLGDVAQKAGAAANGWFVAEAPATEARYVRAEAAPGGDWIFLDELAVNPSIPGPSVRHAALGKSVALAHKPAEVYALGNLTDGVVARSPDFLNPPWIGIEGKNLDATIDLGTATTIKHVRASFLQWVGAGIHIPSDVEIQVSDDGKTFRRAAAAKRAQDDRPTYIHRFAIDVGNAKARYVRVVARTNGQWLFADEIAVNPEGE